MNTNVNNDQKEEKFSDEYQINDQNITMQLDMTVIPNNMNHTNFIENEYGIFFKF